MYWASAILIWIIGGFLGYGFTLGTFTNQFPHFRNTKQAWMVALLGPLGFLSLLFVSYMSDFQIHWRLKSLTDDERWKAFQDDGFGILGREFFERNS